VYGARVFRKRFTLEDVIELHKNDLPRAEALIVAKQKADAPVAKPLLRLKRASV
jgi:hypothetical protein